MQSSAYPIAASGNTNSNQNNNLPSAFHEANVHYSNSNGAPYDNNASGTSSGGGIYSNTSPTTIVREEGEGIGHHNRGGQGGGRDYASSPNSRLPVGRPQPQPPSQQQQSQGGGGGGGGGPYQSHHTPFFPQPSQQQQLEQRNGYTPRSSSARPTYHSDHQQHREGEEGTQMSALRVPNSSNNHYSAEAGERLLDGPSPHQFQQQQQHQPTYYATTPNLVNPAAVAGGGVVPSYASGGPHQAAAPLPPNARLKSYPAPSYQWSIGNFRERGPFVCPSDWFHGLVIIFFIVAPCAIFLAGVRDSDDIASLIVVPILAVCDCACILLATTLDPGIYRKRVITEGDRSRVRRQQVRKENELRAKRGLPLLPETEMDMDNAHLYHQGHVQGGPAAPVPPAADGSFSTTAGAANNTISSGAEGGPQPPPPPTEAIVWVSDEDHPNRLNFNRISLKSVGGGDNGNKKRRGGGGDVLVECTMCTACGIMKNPRVGHCFVCNVCVDDFDHHCGVVGSCVAKRTFRFFAGIMYFTTFLALYVFIRVVIVFATSVKFPDDLKTDSGRMTVIGGIGVMICCLGAGCSTMPLMFVYMRLAAINSTQKQEGSRPNYHSATIGEGPTVPPANPFATNYCYDFFVRMFGPLGGSRADKTGERGRLHASCEEIY